MVTSEFDGGVPCDGLASQIQGGVKILEGNSHIEWIGVLVMPFTSRIKEAILVPLSASSLKRFTVSSKFLRYPV